VEKHPPERRESYDPECYLCPGNERAGGIINPQYKGTFVFDNDYAALVPNTPDRHMDEKGLLVAHSEPGICRVVCFSPDHGLTLAEMETEEIRQVVDVWADQYVDLGSRPEIGYVQIFENKGEMMGCSNLHPHGQIWSSARLPHLPELEQISQASYLNEKASCLLCDYLALEVAHEDRLICGNDAFVAMVPFWAIWPYEAMILGRRHVGSVAELSEGERTQLADLIRRLMIRFDNLFETSFPYSMGLHQAPTDDHKHPEWHFHMHFYPPLLRSATVKKFMVGYEMLANPQRDLSAESAAERLRNLAETRFDS
jgi:UDPglucose--hexose-1-phosphate uridylyltransferase